jgi:hypothetical protein
MEAMKWIKFVVTEEDVAVENPGRKPSPCKDCGKDTTPFDRRGKPLFERFDHYIVRDEIWAEAGMNGWDSGYLCTRCLERRLGRKLVNADYLARPTGSNSKGLKTKAHPDYHQHPSVKAQRPPNRGTPEKYPGAGDFSLFVNTREHVASPDSPSVEQP